MSLHAKLIAYLCAMHLFFFLPLTDLYRTDLRLFFLAEMVFIVSLLVGVHLAARLRELTLLLQSGADSLREAQFSHRLRRPGQVELDRLVDIYNRMLGELRAERLRMGEQRGFLEKLLAATPAAIVVFDFEGRITTVNPSAESLFAADRDDLADKRLSEIGTPLALALDALAPGESRVLAHQGRRRLKCAVSRFRDRGFLRSFLLVEEVTSEMRQTERVTYETLIRMMSHEVNNSLGAAISLIDSCAALERDLPPPKRGEFARALAVVGNRMSHLQSFMARLSDFVRLPPPHKERAGLLPLLRDIEVLMAAECQRRNIRWIWDNGEARPEFAMDIHQMEQVFLNAVKNAIEAIGEDGWLKVELRRRGPHWALALVDSGGALEPGIQARLFTPFFTTKKGGQGLGLMLIGDILTRHGFDFTLEGTPGVETRFTILFPAEA